MLVVCIGNVCRSPYVESRIRKRIPPPVVVHSAGTQALTGQGIDVHTLQLLAEMHIDGSEFRAKQLTADLVREADLILTLTRGIRSDVVAEYPHSLPKIFALADFSDLAAHLQQQRPDVGEMSVRGLAEVIAGQRASSPPRDASRAEVQDPYRLGPQAARLMQTQIEKLLPPIFWVFDAPDVPLTAS